MVTSAMMPADIKPYVKADASCFLFNIKILMILSVLTINFSQSYSYYEKDILGEKTVSI